MSALAEPLMTVDQFLADYEGRDGRWEIEDGKVFAMGPETLAHARVKMQCVLTLRDAIHRAGLPCEAVLDSIAVRISARTAYIPDALVYCGPRLPPDTREAAPVVVVEVISPSTQARDERRKFVGYFSRPSVRHYLTLDPRDRTAFHHRREDDGRIETRLISEGPLRLDPPGLEFTVSDLFGEP